MGKRLAALAVVIAAAGVAFFMATRTDPLPASALPQHTPDLANGKIMYTVAGCHACHEPPEGAKDRSQPIGGRPLKTPVGTFYPPNLTPDPETGIGKWTDAEFVDAVARGISRQGENLFPAMPYASYGRMKLTDILDIKAYLDTLPTVVSPARQPDIALLWLMRRGIGLWKRIGFHPKPIEPDPAQTAAWNRGAYLVNGPGHCGECHTPRNIFMVMQQSRFLEGAPSLEGKGKVPSLINLVGRGKFKDAADLDSALRWGEAFGYDDLSSGGMGEVQDNLSKLPKADTKAIADYLVSLK